MEEEKEDLEKEKEEPTKEIYDTVREAYNFEWQRTRDIENKATNVVGFTGVIFSLTIASLVSIISSDNKGMKEQIFSLRYSHFLIFMILALMTSSIICGIMVVTVKHWWTLIVDKYLERCSDGKKTQREVQKFTIRTYKKCANMNSKNNEKIANLLRMSHYLFLSSIILLLIYIMYIISYIN